uniref:Uncharacterized protein n=1 Tax=Aegilops tauschii subsp. strangulata TaxID=200361 RepID=A0A453NX44_AEGTS
PTFNSVGLIPLINLELLDLHNRVDPYYPTHQIRNNLSILNSLSILLKNDPYVHVSWHIHVHKSFLAYTYIEKNYIHVTQIHAISQDPHDFTNTKIRGKDPSPRFSTPFFARRHHALWRKLAWGWILP